jgi:uncharacterized protein
MVMDPSCVRRRCILAAISLCTFAVLCSAQEGMRGPRPEHRPMQLEQYGTGNNVAIDFYQRYISPARGEGGCPMHPSCSQFAKIAFEQRSWYEAYVLTLERLLRCGNDLQYYPLVRVGDEVRWYDPVHLRYEESDEKCSTHGRVGAGSAPLR